MLHSLSITSSFSSSSKTLKRRHFTSTSHPSSHVKFRTTRHENLRYLKAIGVIDPNTKPHQLPSPDDVTHIITMINFFKSKSFIDADFARLASLCPQVFTVDFNITDVQPIFEFLTEDLRASPQELRGLVNKCPQLLLSDVEYCLKPTLDYLSRLGVTKLNIPSNLNAHILNTREEKLRKKVKFLKSIGLSHEEAAKICARLPAIFGYSVENNLRPKVEFLVEEMERSLEELKEFPQYFAFSLEGRIVPRHLHLKERDVKIKLKRMLLWSDERFYKKWK